MKRPKMVALRPSVPGAGSLLAETLVRIRDECLSDPLAESNGDGIASDLLEAFHSTDETARFLLLVGIFDGHVVGHAVGRLDLGYENRRHCTLGFYKLDKGYQWRTPVIRGMRELEAWATRMGCSELRIATFDRAHVRLYGMPKYGGFKPLFVTLSRRISS